jgi:hypothetical protein
VAFCGTLHDTAIGIGDAQWLARPSVDHQHGRLHGAGTEPVQGLLAGLSKRLRRRFSGPMGKKEREDDATKDFKKAVKADKPSKKEKKRVDKITKHLSKNEKI